MILKCLKCGNEYQIVEEEDPSDFECECGGILEELSQNVYKREVITYKKYHTEEMAERYTYSMIGGIIFAVLSFIPIFIFRHPIIILIFISSVGLATESKRKRSSWGKGARGERIVANVLNKLPQNFYVFNDVKLPIQKGNIDHVILGPTGIFTIETKNYSDNFTIDGDKWFREGSKSRYVHYDPGKQAKEASVKLMNYLSQSGLRGVKWVKPIIVLIKEDGYRIKKLSKDYVVLSPSKVDKYITGQKSTIDNKKVLEFSLILNRIVRSFLINLIICFLLSFLIEKFEFILTNCFCRIIKQSS